MNRLEEIIAVKRGEIAKLREGAGPRLRRAEGRSDFRDFRGALRRPDGNLAVIAEVKKASPSAGLIAESFVPSDIAQQYERTGAQAISVLTDEKFFQGALAHLIDARRSVLLPVLRKDFVIDELQIEEAADAGADAILLIVAALSQKELVDLSAAAAKNRVDALVEVHTGDELQRALDAGAVIIGINNRNLETFDVDLAVTEKLSADIPQDIVLVSESGIKTAEDVARIKACEVDAILVGEALMRGELSIEMIAAA
ncbi:MAG: indole-3-glycerol phosphate synthase TrpC [Spartobacteria bacterium]